MTSISIRQRGDCYIVIVQPNPNYETVEYIGPFPIARFALAWTMQHLTKGEQFEIVPMDNANLHDYDDNSLFAVL